MIVQIRLTAHLLPLRHEIPMTMDVMIGGMMLTR